MPIAKANGIEIAYDTFGNVSDPALLLIVGLGGQLIFWDEELCKELARSGLYVIRFDNRDVGLSTKMEEAGVPDIMGAMGALMEGREVTPPYTLGDMADDAVGLLDALGIQKAHVCGMSMGGMIAQDMAIRYPRRVMTLTSVYSHTGNRELPQPDPEIMTLVLTPPPSEREGALDLWLRTFKTIAGPGFPFDEDWVRGKMAEALDRSFHPEGVARQFMAILTQEDRRSKLGSLKIPTLVVHGADDPLVPVEGGKDTAAAIPGAKLMIIDGMGHDIPHGGAWPEIAKAVIALTKEVAA